MSVPSIEQIAATLVEAGFGEVRVEDLERAAIINALAGCQGNRTHAAQSSAFQLERCSESWQERATARRREMEQWQNSAKKTPATARRGFYSA